METPNEMIGSKMMELATAFKKDCESKNVPYLEAEFGLGILQGMLVEVKFKYNKESQPVTETLCQRAYKIALGEMGVHEIPGPKNNARILEYHRHTNLKATDEEVPWCSAFMNFCIQEAGGSGTSDAMARSWLRWGHAVTSPQKGDIVVFSSPSRGPESGHVAFFEGFSGDMVKCTGGNQDNAVCHSEYPVIRVLGYRRSNDVETKVNLGSVPS